MSAPTVRRTRRVDAPFDARLEVRMYQGELEALKSRATEQGLSASDLVRSKLGGLIKPQRAKPAEKAQAPEPTETPDPAPSEPQALTTESGTVDLAEAIAHYGAISWGRANLQVKTGRVTVNGEVYRESEIRADLLSAVEVNGAALRPIEAPEQKRADGGDEQPGDATDDGEPSAAGEEPQATQRD